MRARLEPPRFQVLSPLSLHRLSVQMWHPFPRLLRAFFWLIPPQVIASSTTTRLWGPHDGFPDCRHEDELPFQDAGQNNLFQRDSFDVPPAQQQRRCKPLHSKPLERRRRGDDSVAANVLQDRQSRRATSRTMFALPHPAFFNS